MASYSKSSLTSLLLCVLLFLAVVTATAARRMPGSSNRKQPECNDHEGTVLVPGIGRFTVGPHPETSPAGGAIEGAGAEPEVTRPRYIPGNDDTLVPNPGFEVPNPVP